MCFNNWREWGNNLNEKDWSDPYHFSERMNNKNSYQGLDRPEVDEGGSNLQVIEKRRRRRKKPTVE